jgi:hypothetical protein
MEMEVDQRNGTTSKKSEDSARMQMISTEMQRNTQQSLVWIPTMLTQLVIQQELTMHKSTVINRINMITTGLIWEGTAKTQTIFTTEQANLTCMLAIRKIKNLLSIQWAIVSISMRSKSDFYLLFQLSKYLRTSI